MLEYVCFVTSLFLFAYATRMLIFLCAAWNHYSKSMQVTHQPPPVSTFRTLQTNNKIRHITYVDNVILHDQVIHATSEIGLESGNSRFIKNEQLRNSDNIESTSSAYSDLDIHSTPAVSIIVATNNEQSVIEALLTSVQMLNYNEDRFEVIVVDDSTDSTAKILEKWTERMKNLKVIRRKQRIGSKGAALNLGLEYLREDSSWIIIIDADTILPPDIIEQFLFLLNETEEDWQAIQGYCIPYNNHFNPNIDSSNWVSRGIEFRLAQRNMIEFVARNRLCLPVQITGNLFMIKTSIFKDFHFSNDICEDWDLTLSLYLSRHQSKTCNKKISFYENLNASNQAPTSFSSYFKQRLRVSEGHTRGFIKNIPKLIVQKQSIKNKIEIFFTGFRYLQYILILSLLLLDLITLLQQGSPTFHSYFIMSLAIQCLCLFAVILVNSVGLVICSRSRRYNFTFFISKLLVEITTLPALIIGTLTGIFRKKGVFHRTLRIASRA